jgi:hypothetical protein
MLPVALRGLVLCKQKDPRAGGDASFGTASADVAQFYSRHVAMPLVHTFYSDLLRFSLHLTFWLPRTLISHHCDLHCTAAQRKPHSTGQEHYETV